MARLLVSLLLVALLAQPLSALATSKAMVVKKDLVYSHISLKKFNTKLLQKRLRSGITQRILYKLTLYREGTPKPVAGFVKYCKVTYDLWDEKFTLRCVTPGKRIKIKVKKLKSLLKHLLWLELPILHKKDVLPTASHYMKVKVQLNPVSPKLLKKLRLWMRQSESAAVGTNYVGSFLGLFISKDIGGYDLEVTDTTKLMTGAEILR